jgi:hypothetical protein
LSPSLMRDRVKPAEADIAFANLAEVQLDRLEAMRSLSVPVVIADTPDWVHIRHVWGEPDYIIAAISPSQRSIYCLSDLGLAIDMIHQGSRVQTESSAVPHGYSLYSRGCATVAVKFRASPGNKLTVSITKSKMRPLPPGELIIRPEWWNTKDKIVGISLDEDVRQLIPILFVLGSLLALPAAVLLFRVHFRRKPN